MLHTIIIIGRSGCGKGTQVELLKKYFSNIDNTPIFQVESGARFREFINGSSYSSELSHEIYKESTLQPLFLSIWMWSDLLINQMKGNEHLIIDGIPRRPDEIAALESALEFYHRPMPFVIHLDISREEAVRRLKSRGRSDDKDMAEIDRRMNWYESDVEPTINRFATSPKYHYVHVNGERTPEEIHADIVAAL